MKTFSLFLTLVLTSMAFARPTVDLDQYDIQLGTLGQEKNAAASETFEIKRTSLTPDKVKISANFTYYDQFCTLWAVRRVFIPGRHVTTCRVIRNGRRTRRVCRRVWRPGHYVNQRFCAQWDFRPFSASKELILDFDKAKTLGQGEAEIFELTLSQPGFNSRDLAASARAVSTSVPYEVTKRGSIFNRDGLNFKALK